MNLFYALGLGLLQGLTEFLPVSSSGHLVIAQYFWQFGEGEERLAFDLALHIGTVLSLVAIYYRDIFSTIKSLLAATKKLLLERKWSSDESGSMGLKILWACVPTGIIGIAFKDFFESLFSKILPVSLALLVTGVLLFSTKKMRAQGDVAHFSKLRAFVVGFFQGIAIIPGISRSGTTIWAGMLMGLKAEQAAKFSFLLSIPVILGASLLEADIIWQGLRRDPLAYFGGTLAAFVSGYLSVRWLIALISRGRLYYFSYYCWLAGTAVGLYVITS